jgi:hypothetical protein
MSTGGDWRQTLEYEGCQNVGVPTGHAQRWAHTHWEKV